MNDVLSLKKIILNSLDLLLPILQKTKGQTVIIISIQQVTLKTFSYSLKFAFIVHTEKWEVQRVNQHI